VPALCRALTLVPPLALLLEAGAPPERLVLRQGLSDGPSVATASLDAEGRFVAFVSAASLLPADQNGLEDIYLFDRRTRTLTLETIAVDGSLSSGSSLNPELSEDGRYLVFQSSGRNLTGLSDGNDCADVFLRDRQAGTTQRVSVGRDGQEANGRSANAVISGDGAVIAFVSGATNLAPDEDANGTGHDIYWVHRATAKTRRVSRDPDGRPFGTSFSPRLSADGRLVVFAAKQYRNREARGDMTPALDRAAVYLHDVLAGNTVCVSCGREGAFGDVPAFTPDISGNGRVVVFTIERGPSRSDVVLYDHSSRSTSVITRHANARSSSPRLSADGRFVVFESWASNLLCASRCSAEELDENLLPDVYVFDRTTRTFTRASGSRERWWAPSVAPAIDARGSVVVFSSRQPFGPEDETVDFDLFACAPVC
jgi:Tol biopolymer transport system component